MKIKTKRGVRRVRNQRVRDTRFVVTDYTGCSYITAGKEYSYFEFETHEILGKYCCIVGDNLTIAKIPNWYHPIR